MTTRTFDGIPMWSVWSHAPNCVVYKEPHPLVPSGIGFTEFDNITLHYGVEVKWLGVKAAPNHPHSTRTLTYFFTVNGKDYKLSIITERYIDDSGIAFIRSHLLSQIERLVEKEVIYKDYIPEKKIVKRVEIENPAL